MIASLNLKALYLTFVDHTMYDKVTVETLSRFNRLTILPILKEEME